MSETEFLTADELVEVTGYKHVASQREWLDKNGWAYVVNAAGRPIVGRWHDCLRMPRRAQVRRLASAARRATSPGNFLPPPHTHFCNSSAAPCQSPASTRRLSVLAL